MIIWDECSMAHKKSLDARSTKQSKPVWKCDDSLGRWFSPVISRSMPADEFNACLNLFIMWKHIKILKLSMNIHVELHNGQSGEVFPKQLLDIGNGKIPVDISTGYITFFVDFRLFAELKTKLVQNMFPNIVQNRVQIVEQNCIVPSWPHSRNITYFQHSYR